MQSKVINLIVALVLIIVSVVSIATDNAAVRVGAGFGMGERVESVEDLVSVLDFLNSNSKLNLTSRSLNRTSALASRYGASSYDRRGSGYRHDSATVHISTTIKSSSSCTNPDLSGGMREIKQTVERELTIYITEDATYYASEGIFYLSKEIEGKNGNERKTEIAQFNIDVCVTDRDTYVKIHELMLIDNNQEMKIKNKNVDKWIECTEELALDLISIDSSNRDVLSSIGEMLDFLIEEGVIDEDDVSVSLDEKELADVIEMMGEEAVSLEGLDAQMKVDLSNPTTPIISLTRNYDNSKKYDAETYGFSGTISNKVKSDERIVIKDIDNTIIDFDRSFVDIEVETEEEFEKLFVIEEKEDENDD